ncbi:MAG: L-threonate dehydrogenase [Pseudomonadota bacterium]
MSAIAVIGLGSMGDGMAKSCLRAGLTVHGFDAMAEREEAFLATGGAPGSLAEVAPGLDAVLVVVLNAAQTEDLLFGPEGIVPHLKKGVVVISSATVPPRFARAMEARSNAAGISYLDAPISGGSLKAASGELTVLASGTPEAFAAAAPVLDAVAETVFPMGDAAGAGSVMKAVNQLLAGVHVAAMGEALTFGMTQGIAPEMFLDVISKCAGTSWALENRAPHVVAGDYAPRSQIDIWPKDLGIVLSAAAEAGFEAPIAAAALAQFQRAVELGLGAEDDAAIAKVYARAVELTLPGEGE